VLGEQKKEKEPRDNRGSGYFSSSSVEEVFSSRGLSSPTMSYGEANPEMSKRKRSNKSPEKRGPGRLAIHLGSTGTFRSRAKAKQELCEAQEREMRIERKKLLCKLSHEDIMKRGKFNIEKAVEKAEEAPTAHLAVQSREMMVNVIRMANSAGNLRGDYQRNLQVAAGQTIAMVEVLRTRADRTAEEAQSEGSEERV